MPVEIKVRLAAQPLPSSLTLLSNPAPRDAVLCTSDVWVCAGVGIPPTCFLVAKTPPGGVHKPNYCSSLYATKCLKCTASVTQIWVALTYFSLQAWNGFKGDVEWKKHTFTSFLLNNKCFPRQRWTAGQKTSLYSHSYTHFWYRYWY